MSMLLTGSRNLSGFPATLSLTQVCFTASSTVVAPAVSSGTRPFFVTRIQARPVTTRSG